MVAGEEGAVELAAAKQDLLSASLASFDRLVRPAADASVCHLYELATRRVGFASGCQAPGVARTAQGC